MSLTDWTETMALLDDDKLFPLLRLYLGEIKTPYNKQRLIEQLAGFAMNAENQKNMLLFLDEFDIQVLSAVHFIPNATVKKLSDFFGESCSFSDLYTQIINLEQRLFLYRKKTDSKQEEIIYITPMIENALSEYIDVQALIPPATVASLFYGDSFCLSPDFIAAFLSFFLVQGCSQKNDGSIKKNDLKHIEEIFGEKSVVAEKLFYALRALGLIFQTDEGTCCVQKAQLESFSALPAVQQYAFLCTASPFLWDFTGTQKLAQLLIDVLSLVPKEGLTKTSLIRLSFLREVSGSSKPLSSSSRFARMMAEATSSEGSFFQREGGKIERMIENAIVFGLLQKIGVTESGEDVFVTGDVFFNAQDNGDAERQSDAERPKVVSIESTFSINFMPGLTLKELLPFTEFLSVKKSGTVTEYELSKASVSRAFDLSLTPQKILSLLAKYSYYDVPQNLKENVMEWYSSYSSAILYQGYVLKVSAQNQKRIMNNPNVSKFIAEQISDGVFLLNLPETYDISRFMNESSLDFMGKIRSQQKNVEKKPFPLLKKSPVPVNFDFSADKKERAVPSVPAAARLLVELKKSVDDMSVSPSQKEALKSRISNRLIISQAQLFKVEIRQELLEASGMDFEGKLHLLEMAAHSGDMVELKLPDAKNDGGYFCLVGVPLQITRQTSDAVLRFQIEPTKEVNNFAVSRLTHIRRLQL